MKCKYFILLITILIIACSKKKDIVENAIPIIPIVESQVPKLLTKPVSDLTFYSVTIEGSVIDSVGSKITEQGFVVGTSSLPTITNNLNKFKLTALSNGNFITTIVDIPAGTTYFIRAYGINAQGVGYGNEISFKSFSEKVFKGDVTIFTQDELNVFGANNYTTIEGSLNILGSVTDLSPLTSIAVIGNGLVIKNTLLIDFNGLDNLEIVGRDFFHQVWIEYNQSLKSFKGLGKLKIVNGGFYITDNNALINLKGLDSFTTFNFGSFIIARCNNLQSIDGLETLQYLDGRIMVDDNAKLNSLSAFKKLKIVSDRIEITKNKSLTKIDGFESMLKIENIYISDNQSLTELNGFKNLERLEILTIRNNKSLNVISAFNKLTSLNSLIIEYNSKLQSLSGLENLSGLTGSARITNNATLTDFCPLKNLCSKTSDKSWQINNNAINPTREEILNCH